MPPPPFNEMARPGSRKRPRGARPGAAAVVSSSLVVLLGLLGASAIPHEVAQHQHQQHLRTEEGRMTTDAESGVELDAATGEARWARLAALDPNELFRSPWEDERVVYISEEEEDEERRRQGDKDKASLLGALGDASPMSNSRSHRSRWRMESRYADLLVATSEYPFCAWDATTDESVYTPLLLDPNAVYQPQLLSFAAHPDRVYRISARFPKVVYFSYQSYTLRGLPLTSLADLRIDPAWGKNPYRDPSCASEQEAGGYEVYVTRSGDQGWPNEVRGLSEDITNSTWTPYTRVVDFLDNLSIIMLRFYTVKQPPSPWGDVEPPIISYSDDYGKSWATLQPCNDHTRYLFNRAMKQVGWDVFYLRHIFHLSQWYRLRSCALLGIRAADRPNMLPNVALDDPGSYNYVPYANWDSDYLHWCTDGKQLGLDFVMVVEGTAPLTATGLYEGPRRISDVHGYQTRYWGFAAADVFIPGPTYSSVTGPMMEEHYGPGWDRRYKVVAARSRDIAKACGLDDPAALFLPFANPNLNNDPPAIPAIIEREMLARHAALKQPPETQSIGFITERCRDERACYNQTYIEGKLREQYPRLAVYKCDVKTGQATPYTYHPYPRDYGGPIRGWWDQYKASRPKSK